MIRFEKVAAGILLSVGLFSAQAQSQSQTPLQLKPGTAGTLVIVPAEGEVKHPNDEARLVWMIEEQDRDKAVAASRVNQKMKQGMDIIKKADGRAELKTYNYYTYPIYPEDQPPRPLQGTKPRTPTAWRVGQYLEMKTTDLDNLPKTVSSAQRILALNGLQFGLAEKTAKLLDARRIEASYTNLSERIAAIAKAMERSPNDAILDMVDFEGTGAYAPQPEATAKMTMRAAPMQDASMVEEPSFEPGETTLQMRIVGKVKFK